MSTAAKAKKKAAQQAKRRQANASPSPGPSKSPARDTFDEDDKEKVTEPDGSATADSESTAQPAMNTINELDEVQDSEEDEGSPDIHPRRRPRSESPKDANPQAPVPNLLPLPPPAANISPAAPPVVVNGSDTTMAQMMQMVLAMMQQQQSLQQQIASQQSAGAVTTVIKKGDHASLKGEFSGAPPASQKLSAWVKDVDHISHAAKWTDAETLERAVLKLTGLARSWYTRNRTKIESWKALKQMLSDEYGRKETLLEIKRRLSSVTQGPNESVDSYTHRYRENGEIYVDDHPDHYLLSYVEGFQIHLKAHIEKDAADTFDGVLRVALAHERLHRTLNQGKVGPNRNQQRLTYTNPYAFNGDVGVPNQKSNQYKGSKPKMRLTDEQRRMRANRCFHCCKYRPGHSIRDCPFRHLPAVSDDEVSKLVEGQDPPSMMANAPPVSTQSAPPAVKSEPPAAAPAPKPNQKKEQKSSVMLLSAPGPTSHGAQPKLYGNMQSTAFVPTPMNVSPNPMQLFYPSYNDGYCSQPQWYHNGHQPWQQYPPGSGMLSVPSPAQPMASYVPQFVRQSPAENETDAACGIMVSIGNEFRGYTISALLDSAAESNCIRLDFYQYLCTYGYIQSSIQPSNRRLLGACNEKLEKFGCVILPLLIHTQQNICVMRECKFSVVSHLRDPVILGIPFVKHCLEMIDMIHYVGVRLDGVFRSGLTAATHEYINTAGSAEPANLAGGDVPNAGGVGVKQKVAGGQEQNYSGPQPRTVSFQTRDQKAQVEPGSNHRRQQGGNPVAGKAKKNPAHPSQTALNQPQVSHIQRIYVGSVAESTVVEGGSARVVCMRIDECTNDSTPIDDVCAAIASTQCTCNHAVCVCSNKHFDHVEEPRYIKQTLRVKNEFIDDKIILKSNSFSSKDVGNVVPVHVANTGKHAFKLGKGAHIAELELTPSNDVVCEPDQQSAGICTISDSRQPAETLTDEEILTMISHPDTMPMTDQDKKTFIEFMHEFEDVCGSELGDAVLENGIHVEHAIHLKPGKDKPFRSRVYRASPVKDAAIQAQLDKGLANGSIRPSNSPWASPVVVQDKKGTDEKRVCVDYQVLNEVTIDDAYPIPLISDIFDNLRDGKIFSVIDLRAAYHQVRMREKDIPLTAFICRQGLFEWTRMPNGLKGAPQTWQRYANKVMEGLQHTKVYFDDNCIKSETWSIQDHMHNLQETFERLRKHGLKVNLRKCKFLRRCVKFLGHMIDETGIRVDPEKVNAIHQCPAPTNKTKLKSFLGMVGYYRDYNPKFAVWAKPLYALTKDNTLWKWTRIEQNAFELLRKGLAEAPILVHADPDKPYILQTDASTEGISAIISQIGEDGKEHIVNAASRTLRKEELKYPPTELEGLAVVWGVEKFKHYLDNGKPFSIETDHKALQYIFGGNPLNKLSNARLIRWADKLRSYNYEVRYRKGAANGNADALSRNPLPAQPDDLKDHYVNTINAVTDSNSKPDSDMELSIFLPLSDEMHANISQMQRKQREDKKIVAIMNYLQSGEVPQGMSSKQRVEFMYLCEDMKIVDKGHGIELLFH